MFSHPSHIGTSTPLAGGRPWRRWLAAVAAMMVAVSLLPTVPAAPTTTELTAEFSNMPETHDGSRFTFNLTFAPEPNLSYKTLKDHAFTVVNGRIAKAERVKKRPARNLEWIIHVQPDLNDEDNPVGAISITLPASTSCTGQAVICTSGNLPLSNSPQATVALDAGSTTTTTIPVTTTTTIPTTTTTTVPPVVNDEPVVEPPEQLTAAFSKVPESHDGAKFKFILLFTPEPSVSYASLRDHTFTVVGGTVTKAKRYNRTSTSEWSNRKWEITVVPNLDTNEIATRAVTITLPTTTSCSDTGAVCTSGGLMLSDETAVTVPASDDLPDVPGKPQTVTAQPGPDIGRITVTWTEATVGSEADEAVRGYRLQYNCTGDTESVHLGSGIRSYTITGLDRSRNCLINVAARNDGGYGLVNWAGSATTYHQPMNPPQAPASITVTDDENSDGAKVSWTAPAGGDAPTSYQIAYWDVTVKSFQYISHAGTTDLNAVINVTPANLRTVAVRGHLGDVAYEDEGVWGAWATGWHSTAAASKLDAMTQSATLSLSSTYPGGKDIPISSIPTGAGGAMCPSVAGLYVDDANSRAWMADPCSAWVHAFQIGTDGALTYNSQKSLSNSRLYPQEIGVQNRLLTPTTLWSDGETLWVAERDRGMLLPYQLSDGALQHSKRFAMFPLPTQLGKSPLAPAAVWSDGKTAWVVDDMLSGLIFAVNLDNEDEWYRRPEETFVPSAFDTCYIPEYPRMDDLKGMATCHDEKTLQSAINTYYDEVVGAYSDGRWLWVAVDYRTVDNPGELLAFNLLTGERAASRDITLPDALTDPLGMWSDGDNLWVVAKANYKEKLFTFSIPSSG